MVMVDIMAVDTDTGAERRGPLRPSLPLPLKPKLTHGTDTADTTAMDMVSEDIMAVDTVMVDIMAVDTDTGAERRGPLRPSPLPMPPLKPTRGTDTADTTVTDTVLDTLATMAVDTDMVVMAVDTTGVRLCLLYVTHIHC